MSSPISRSASNPRLPLLAGLLCLLAACGGGGSNPAPVPAPLPAPQSLTLSGTAAVGLALANASVQAKCAGAEATATTAADGGFRLQLSGASQPCLLRVSASDGTRLHSLALGAGEQALANITPLTELLVLRASRKDAASLFDGFNPASAPSAAEWRAAESDVRRLLNGVVDLSALPDLVATPLKAATPGQPSTDPQDKLLDALKERASPEQWGSWVRLLASGGPLPDPAAFVPTLALSDTQITLAAGQSHRFTATINYPPNGRYLRPPLRWSVVEREGGAIDALSGAYQAPLQPGTYHVTVVRDDFAGIGATVEVKVVARDAFVPRLSVPAPELSLRVGQSWRFSADTNYPPNVMYIRQPVRWSVLEAEGGRIDALSGQYTAPPQVGQYHVRVEREDFPGVSAQISVQVQAWEVLNLHRGLVEAAPSEQRVVRSAAEFKALVDAWQLQSSPYRPAPQVDFGQDMVLAIAEQGSSGCASLEIADVRAEAGKLLVAYRERPIPPGIACTAVITYPVLLVALPRSELPVEFARRP